MDSKRVPTDDLSHGENAGRVNTPDKSVTRTVGKDKAAIFLENASETIAVTPEENRRILMKIDLTILPIMLAVYFLHGLDKATLSYASVFGLVKDANLNPRG